MNHSNLEKAGTLVVEALTLISRREYPQIYEALDAVWTLIDDQVDFEDEALKWQEE